MPAVRLPDGAEKRFDAPVSVAEVAAAIGPGLARAALAGKVDGRLVDLSHVIDRDSQVAIVTDKDADGVEVLRHSTAHLLAHAVKELFPEAQVTIGPVIEDGFYYDFSYKRPFTPEDLAAIEKRMAEIAKRDLPVRREVWDRSEAIHFFKQQGEHYKAQIIESIPGDEAITLYRQDNFTDLCRGPHVPSTGKLKVFKLMKLAGAYWRGDSRNEMLQRIYGTAWAKKEDLDAYLHRLEEAERRDHRKLGQAARPVSPAGRSARAWCSGTRRAGRIWQQVEQYLRRVSRDTGYHEVRTPLIMDLHAVGAHPVTGTTSARTCSSPVSENRDYAVKPMNCPGHIQIYNQGVRSYRDLPLRLAEFGSCHRNEPSGALHGIMRVRGFVQDDAPHLLHRGAGQLGGVAFIDLLLQKVYRDFGFDEISDQARHPAGQAHRLRRGLGQGGAGALANALDRARAWRILSRRARVRSTGRRSSSR